MCPGYLIVQSTGLIDGKESRAGGERYVSGRSPAPKRKQLWRQDSLAKISLTLLIIVSILRGLVWSTLILPLYGWDEPQHFMYARSIAHSRSLIIGTNTRVPLNLWKLARLENFTPASKHTIAVPNADLVRQQIQSIQAPDLSQDCVNDRKGFVATQSQFNSLHPPLYYTLIALIVGASEKLGILWQLRLSRFLSVILGALAVLFAFHVGKLVCNDRRSLGPLGLATLVCFQPVTAFSFATISNCALEITLFSAFLLLCVRTVYFGLTLRGALLIGAVLSAGMLTKVSFVAAAPLLLLLLAWQYFNRARFSSKPVSLLFMSVNLIALPIVLSWWWYAGTWSSGGDNVVHLFGKVHHLPAFNLVSYLRDYQWGPAYSHVMSTYWGGFGWEGAHLPIPVLGMLTVVTVLSALASVRWMLPLRHFDSWSDRSHAFSIFFLTCSSLALVALCVCLSVKFAATIGTSFVIRGQYYLPAIIAQMLWLVLAMPRARNREQPPRGLFWLCAVMVVLSFSCLFGVVVPHCVSGANLIQQCSRVALFQPIALTLLFILIGLFVVASCLLLASLFVLAKDSHGDSEEHNLGGHNASASF